MDIIIGILLSTRLFTFLAGGLTPGDVPASLSAPQIAVREHRLVLSCTVLHGFPTQLRHVAESATPIYLYLFTELHRPGETDAILSAATESVLLYDDIARVYKVKQSTQSDTVVCSTLDSAIDAMSMFRGSTLTGTEKLDPAAKYEFVLYAVLGKTRVEALDGKEVDLMYYWNYKRPMVRTEACRGALLMGRK